MFKLFNYAKLMLRTYISDEEGQGMAEYALILAGIAVVVIAAVFLLGDTINELFGEVETQLEVEQGDGT